jgi:hypothetical protein
MLCSYGDTSLVEKQIILCNFHNSVKITSETKCYHTCIIFSTLVLYCVTYKLHVTEDMDIKLHISTIVGYYKYLLEQAFL